MINALSSHFWDYLAAVFSLVGIYAAVMFVVTYWRDAGKAAWRNPFGRFMLVRKSLLALLFGYVLANRVVLGIPIEDAWPGQGLVWSMLLGAFALHTFTPYRLLVEAQRAHTPKEEAP